MLKNIKNLSTCGLRLSASALLIALFTSSLQLAAAEEVSAEVKAKAQLTLAQWMKDRSDDTGKFYFVDRKQMT